jgi:hypothetical protein
LSRGPLGRSGCLDKSDDRQERKRPMAHEAVNRHITFSS